MRPEPYPRPLDSTRNSSSGSGLTRLESLIALVLALLLVPIFQGALLAQQSPDGQYNDGQSSGQYAPDQQQPDQQQNDQQPGYAPQPGAQQPSPQQGYAQPQPLSPQDVQQLVAPIALYPDALVAQVLAASTYPQQVADADRWRRAQAYASSDQIAAAADAQPWDPSVKSLTAFPQVLAQMDQNLHWTSELGNAYYNQPQDVLEAVQVMRQRAQSAGNLQSTPQESVSYDQGNIELAPVNPQIIYVPAYNPWTVYGAPIAPYPGFSLLGAIGSFFGSTLGPSFGAGAVRFGLGIAMTAFLHTPWGFLGWGLNWLTQAVLFNHSNYFSHSTTVADWGFPHGGPRAFSQRGTFAANRSYRPFGAYGRPNGGYNGARSQSFAGARNGYASSGNRSGESYSRNYQPNRSGYNRTSPEAYNRPQSPFSQQYRSQPSASQRYNSSGYGSNFNGRSSYDRSPYGRPTDNYSNRAATNYGNSMRANRAPSASLQSSDFGKRSFSSGFRSSGGFKGNGFGGSSGKREHSGGFHFGGGHTPKAPKAPHMSKSSGRAHSGGGGHFGGHGHSGGKHRG
ncbi:MAG: DUF3300 domain-containing protein [Candidatus Sulfotelmatobacter sp.]